jgi:hypothetical protein
MSITKIVAIVASAIGAAGMLTIPWSASAEPACLDWRFAEDALFLNLDNGVLIGVPWLGGTNKVRTTKGAVRLDSPDGGFWQGDIGPGGGTRQGSKIDFRVDWTINVGNEHPVSVFTGQIDPNGVASGTVVNEKNVTNGWTAQGKFTCSAREAAPLPAAEKPIRCTGGEVIPAGQTCPKKEAPPAQSVTVKKPSDVYDAPGGNRLGPETYFLTVDRVLTIAEPCRDNWCLLNIPDPEVPGGKGWVYSGEGFLELP